MINKEKDKDIEEKEETNKGHLRNIDFFISTSNGLTVNVGKTLLKRKEVVSACTCIGEPTIDLRVATHLKTNLDIANMLEYIKGTDGGSNASWSEIIEVIGRKKDDASSIQRDSLSN